MNSEAAFRKCTSTLDSILAAFTAARKEIRSPFRYEADSAAYQLLEVAWRHVNSISHLAMLSPIGSHHISTYPLARAAFETGLTSLWLSNESDWEVREARWLGCIKDEEVFQQKLSREFKTIDESFSQRRIDYSKVLAERREAISKLLPVNARNKRPDFRSMLRECNIGDNYYIAYAIHSHLSHAGPSVLEEVWKNDELGRRTARPALTAWSHTFKLASWSIAQPGIRVLQLAQIDENLLEALSDLHKVLLSHADQLNAVEKLDSL